MRVIKFGFLSALLIALSSSSASAIGYKTVFTEAEAANGDASLTFLETVISDGTTAYAVLRDAPNTGVVGGINAFDGSSFTTVMTPAQYAGSGATLDYAAGEGGGVVGSTLRAVNFFSNSVVEVDLGTGTATEVVPKATFDALISDNASLVGQHETTADGTIYALESRTDQILAVSPGNVASIEVGTADLAALAGGTTIRGLGVLGNTLLIGSNSNDSLVSWDTVNNLGATVLTTAEIQAANGGSTSVSFGDIFAAPDDLVYFYEGGSDSLMSFDPTNAAGTLKVVVSEAEFLAGPGSDSINQLSYFNGRISWTDGSIGYFQVVPEPASLSLVLLSLCGLAAARRR